METKSLIKFSKEVIEYLNQARVTPKKFADKIAERMKYFKGKVLFFPDSHIGIMTQEGAEAYQEAIDFLNTVAPLPEMKYSVGLTHIAKDIVEAAQQVEDLNLLDELDMNSIFDKYGHFTGSFSRGMDFGSRDPIMVVVNLIVSDGDKTRNQREGIFNSALKEVGVWTGSEKRYGQCTIITSATMFIDKPGAENNFDNQIVGDNSYKTHNVPQTQTHVVAKDDDDDDMNLPEGVKAVDKFVKVVVEGGKKKRITKIVRHMENGSTETEINKETIDE